jgi:hypothetical protein
MLKTKYELITWFKKLGYTKGAEIGVAEGHFSEALCQGIPGLELYCIDLWRPYRGNPWSGSTERNDHHFKTACERLNKYNTHIIRELSMDAVKQFKDGSLDFVFIDANHKFDYVIQDLIEWTKKVKVGGVVSGDDYYPFSCGHQDYGGVVDAVNAYTKAHGIKFELTDPLTDKIQDRNCQEQPCYYFMRE